MSSIENSIISIEIPIVRYTQVPYFSYEITDQRIHDGTR